MEYFHEFIKWIIEATRTMGYPGIFVLMAVESSIIPVPSELVLIPAGYLISQGEMSWAFLLIAANVGSLVGSLANYYVSRQVGRPLVERFIDRYGKYVLLKRRHFESTERFFDRNGEIAIFTARLLPGVRHLISIPAGLARMKTWKFSLYTFVGAGLWSLVLTLMGYVIGKNQELLTEELIRRNARVATICTFLFIICLITGYVLFRRWWDRRNANI